MDDWDSILKMGAGQALGALAGRLEKDRDDNNQRTARQTDAREQLNMPKWAPWVGGGILVLLVALMVRK